MNAIDLSGVVEATMGKPGEGRAVMFISAQAGEGVSAIVRHALRDVRQLSYAIDLDVRRNGLARQLVAEGANLSPAVEADFGGAVLFEALDSHMRVWPLSAPIFAFHRLGGTKTYIGACNTKVLPAGGRCAYATRQSSGRLRARAARPFWSMRRP